MIVSSTVNIMSSTVTTTVIANSIKMQVKNYTSGYEIYYQKKGERVFVLWSKSLLVRIVFIEMNMDADTDILTVKIISIVQMQKGE